MIADLEITRVLILLVVLIISLTVHEASHALFAKLGGDPTAYLGGQVTLNPVPHMQREPFGMIALPILSLLVSNGTMPFGFAHAPYDPIWAHHNPRKAALMSAAGPFANVALMTVAFVVMYLVGRPGGDATEAVFRIAHWFLLLNLLLALLNLVPLPPLDGAGVVAGLFPATRSFYRSVERIPGIGLIVLVAIFYGFGKILWPVYDWVVQLLPYWKPPY